METSSTVIPVTGTVVAIQNVSRTDGWVSVTDGYGGGSVSTQVAHRYWIRLDNGREINLSLAEDKFVARQGHRVVALYREGVIEALVNQDTRRYCTLFSIPYPESGIGVFGVIGSLLLCFVVMGIGGFSGGAFFFVWPLCLYALYKYGNHRKRKNWKARWSERYDEVFPAIEACL